MAISRFEELFDNRRAYCRGLLNLSRLQQELIDTENYRDLFSLLAQKQTMLDAFQVAEGERQATLVAWKSERQMLNATVRERCEQILFETESLLRQLFEQEEAGANQIRAQRDDTQRELNAIAGSGNIRAAYDLDDRSPLQSRIRLET